MDREAIPDWARSFAAFCARCDDHFTRSESRPQARKDLRGLLAGRERKTTGQVAEVVQDGTPDRMQRVLYRAPWEAQTARDRVQQFVIERLGDPEALAVLDETSIPNQGIRSLGVQTH
jgi:SRSO17 transposase